MLGKAPLLALEAAQSGPCGNSGGQRRARGMIRSITCADKVYQKGANAPLLALLPDRPAARVLDCGCGAGDNARILHARGWSVAGITISAREKEQASPYCESVCLADLNEGIPSAVGAGFDVVLMAHVLEHLTRPERLLSDVKGVLSPDGVVAVALPNALFCHVRLQFLLGRFEYREDGIMDETHVHFYSFETASRLLKTNGFDVLTARAHGALPLWRLRKILPSSFVQWLDDGASRRLPGLFGIQFLFLARPAAGALQTGH